MKTAALTAIVLALALPCLAQEGAADIKYKNELELAKKAYSVRVEQAKVVYLGALKSALDQATAKKNTDEVERLKKKIEAVEAEGSIRTVNFECLATKPWQKVVEVNKGDVIKIEAKGKWAYAPGHFFEAGGDKKDVRRLNDFEAPLGAMLGKVGDSVYLVGESYSITVKADGVLDLRPHDSDGGLHDNSGKLDVTVKIIKAPTAPD